MDTRGTTWIGFVTTLSVPDSVENSSMWTLLDSRRANGIYEMIHSKLTGTIPFTLITRTLTRSCSCFRQHPSIRSAVVEMTG